MAIPGGPALADTSISGLANRRLLRELARGMAVATSTQRSYGKRSHWLCFGPHDKCPAFACLADRLLSRSSLVVHLLNVNCLRRRSECALAARL